MSREELIAALVRHPFKKNNAAVAVNRIVGFVDVDGAGMIRLRNAGLRAAETLIASAASAN